jgi:UPF0042 nucleotide-binding protein
MRNILLITGISGAGRTTAVKTLEDLGYYCVDNLPVPLFNQFLHLMREGGKRYTHIAIAIDSRSRDFFERDFQTLGHLVKKHKIKVLYLDANDEVILRRYKESRRKHPLDDGLGASQAVNSERQFLEKLRVMADYTIDTSSLNVHEFEKTIYQNFNIQGGQNRTLHVVLNSFGFKYGHLSQFDLVLDSRFLPNPFFVPELKMYTGKDGAVIEFLNQNAEVVQFLEYTMNYLNYLLPHFLNEGKVYLNVGIGCTGGKHRSVYLVEKVAELIDREKYTVSIKHRDLGKE